MGPGITAWKMDCAGATSSYLTCLVLTLDSSSGEVDEAMKGKPPCAMLQFSEPQANTLSFQQRRRLSSMTMSIVPKLAWPREPHLTTMCVCWRFATMSDEGVPCEWDVSLTIDNSWGEVWWLLSGRRWDLNKRLCDKVRCPEVNRPIVALTLHSFRTIERSGDVSRE